MIIILLIPELGKLTKGVVVPNLKGPINRHVEKNSIWN